MLLLPPLADIRSNLLELGILRPGFERPLTSSNPGMGIPFFCSENMPPTPSLGFVAFFELFAPPLNLILSSYLTGSVFRPIESIEPKESSSVGFWNAGLSLFAGVSRTLLAFFGFDVSSGVSRLSKVSRLDCLSFSSSTSLGL